MGNPYGGLPWGIPMGRPHGDSPWGFHMGNPQRQSPWVISRGNPHGESPWGFPMAEFATYQLLKLIIGYNPFTRKTGPQISLNKQLLLKNTHIYIYIYIFRPLTRWDGFVVRGMPPTRLNTSELCKD